MRSQLGTAPANAKDVATKAYVDANANPGTKITGLPVYAVPDIDDIQIVVDVSDTTEDASGTTDQTTNRMLFGMQQGIDMVMSLRCYNP